MKFRSPYGVSLAIILVAALGCNSVAGYKGGHNLPPAQQLMEPGPGVGGPGPGVIEPMGGMGGVMPVGYDGMMAGDYGYGMCGDGAAMGGGSAQVLFGKPQGMQVRWDISGSGDFESVPLITPGRQNFAPGAIYRLKLTNIQGREGVELYPTIELGNVTPRTAAFLAHNAVPIQFTEEDFSQVLSGNFVTKVIYLPDPEFQELALAGVETLVSTRLDPGTDPVVEADRRGAILAIIRLGNIDPEMPGMDGGYETVLPAGYSEAAMHDYNSGAYSYGAGYGSAGPAPAPMMAPISGVTAPQWGMPYCGTPIGLPGPPHIPLGVPAGLQSQTIHNHTCVNLPCPVEHQRIDVRQSPGISYPRPPHNAWVHEQMIHPSQHFDSQPCDNKFQLIPSAPGGGACATGACPY